MQLDLNGSLGCAAVLGGLKDTAEDVGRARTGLLPSIAGVKSHHGMGNQVNGFGLVGKALKEQFTFLKVKSRQGPGPFSSFWILQLQTHVYHVHEEAHACVHLSTQDRVNSWVL